jgi:hypothetical protein
MKSQREERYRKIKAGDYKLLYVSPERFRKKEFIEVIKSRKVSLLHLMKRTVSVSGVMISGLTTHASVSSVI